MNLEQVSKLESKLLVSTYDRYPVLLHKGRGVYLYDNKGRKYLDLLSGIGVNALGYAHPALTKTIAKQAKLLVHTSNLFYHEYQGRLAAALTKISGMDRAFFTNSGTEAWEGALKLARAYAKANCAEGKEPKWRILALEHAFHGTNVSALWRLRTRKNIARRSRRLCREWSLSASMTSLIWKASLTPPSAPLDFEFVQGEGGIRPVSQQFADTAHKLARKHNALLIADEIQSGMGRTGRWFAYQNYNIQPDLVTVAKPIAGGLPLGALLATEKVSECIHPGMHGTTFGGGPLACAVALQLIAVLEKDKMLKHIRKVGDYFMEELQKLQKKHHAIVDVRGQGLMIGMELESAEMAKQVFQQMLKLGTIVNRTDETVIRFLPPFIIKKHHIDTAVQQLEQVLAHSTKTAATAGRNK